MEQGKRVQEGKGNCWLWLVFIVSIFVASVLIGVWGELKNQERAKVACGVCGYGSAVYYQRAIDLAWKDKTSLFVECDSSLFLKLVVDETNILDKWGKPIDTKYKLGVDCATVCNVYNIPIYQCNISDKIIAWVD